MGIVLKNLAIDNWKSIRSLKIDLEQINVLIGPNGSGKSNLIHLFSMLNMMMTGSLQLYIARQGGAESLLHYGVKESIFCDSSLTFQSDNGSNAYDFRLVHGAPDTMIFSSEKVIHLKKGFLKPYVEEFGAGHKESALTASANQKGPPGFIRGVLSKCRYFQFHDTALESFIRRKSKMDDNRYLFSNGGNVSSILYRLQNEYPGQYSRIKNALTRVIPSFSDFILQPDNGFLHLEWIDSFKGQRFGPHQMSDGSIRLIALLTLLYLPDELAPFVIIIDEPELGLFPMAIDTLVDAIRDASAKSQIILATQSNRLVRYLGLPSVVCCSWKHGQSEISRMSPGDEYDFMDSYTLGDYFSAEK